MSGFTAMANWQLMWLICFALFGVLKAISVWPFAGRMAPGLRVGYVFGWPGLDPVPFLATGTPQNSTPSLRDLATPLIELAVGAMLLWGLSPRAAGVSDLLQGWIGLVGIALLLHFGVFRVLQWAWNRGGVAVRPIMDAPLRATSLEEFWGRRWNRAFRDFSHAWIFRPAARRLGPQAAMVAVFLFSGLLHDVAISVPAGGGYGLPTAYFGLQYLGVLLQRSRFARRLGFDRGPAGWGLTALLVLGPVGWLFHPPFVRTVVIPFLAALEASHEH